MSDNVIAEIYFDTDDDKLDTQDVQTLETIASELSVILLGQRVELTFIGHADHRGSRTYNEKLGQRRAESVRQFFEHRLGRFSSYSSWKVVSRGETVAAQGDVSKRRMAQDRRVDIISSYKPPRVIVLPGIEIKGDVPPVPRIVYREWSRFGCSNLGRPPTSGRDVQRQAEKDLLQGVLRAIVGGSTAWAWGTEKKERRKTKMIPAHHAVNQVDMHKSYSYDVEGFAECEFWDMDVYYKWGPRQPMVTVNVHQRNTAHGRTMINSKTTKRVKRAEADASSIFFPPDPKK
jgi:hypothetical protein